MTWTPYNVHILLWIVRVFRNTLEYFLMLCFIYKLISCATANHIRSNYLYSAIQSYFQFVFQSFKTFILAFKNLLYTMSLLDLLHANRSCPVCTGKFRKTWTSDFKVRNTLIPEFCDRIITSYCIRIVKCF